MSDHHNPEPIEPVWGWVGFVFFALIFAAFLVLIFLIARHTQPVWAA